MKITRRQLRRIIREAVENSSPRAMAKEIMDWYETVKDDVSIVGEGMMVEQLINLFEMHSGRRIPEGIDRYAVTLFLREATPSGYIVTPHGERQSAAREDLKKAIRTHGRNQEKPDSFEEMKRRFPKMSLSQYHLYLDGFEEVKDDDTIINTDDLYNMIMDTEQPYQAWQDGVRRVGDFREYISDIIDAARRGGMSKKDINSITSKAWKTETSARRRGRRERYYSFLD